MNTTVPHDLLIFQWEDSPYTLHVTTETHFSNSEQPKNIMHGIVKMYVILLPLCWTTFLYELVQSCIDKL